MRYSLMCFLALALSVLARAGAPDQSTPKQIWERNAPLPKGFNVGDAFPTMTLPSAADGRPMSVADFRGRKLIVNIFASW